MELYQSPYSLILSIATTIVGHLPSRYFFSNQKTVVSVDFGVCPLMRKVNGRYVSKSCPGCYAVNLLNTRPNVAEKHEGLPNPKDQEQLQKFEESLQMLRSLLPVLNKLRFYALGDFDPSHIPYIRLAAQYFPEVDIISKSLAFPKNEKHLRELLTIDNVWISLSFNKQFTSRIRPVSRIIWEHPRANLNYALNYDEENPDDLPFKDLISVWHIKNKYKRQTVNSGRFLSLTESRTCGMFDGDGNPVTIAYYGPKNGQEYTTHPSCFKCTVCRTSLKNRMEQSTY